MSSPEISVRRVMCFDIKICKADKIPRRQLWKLPRLLCVGIWQKQSFVNLPQYCTCELCGMLAALLQSVVSCNEAFVFRWLNSSLCENKPFRKTFNIGFKCHWRTKLSPQVHGLCLSRGWVLSAPGINRLRSWKTTSFSCFSLCRVDTALEFSVSKKHNACAIAAFSPSHWTCFLAMV